MDTVAEMIARFHTLTPDESGECHGKVEIVEQLQDSFADGRVVDFFLAVLGDEVEHDLARVVLCKFLELDPPATPDVRRRIAERLGVALRVEQDELVRQWLGIALRGYTDLPSAFEAATACAADPDDDESTRYNCLAAIERLGPTREVVNVFERLAAGSDSLATSARRRLSEWGQS